VPFLQKSYVTGHTQFNSYHTNLEVPCNNLFWRFAEIEHISPEQPYRLNFENRAQITNDDPGDMYFDEEHVSPCISPEENAENSAQNEQLRRSGDSGDICS
jgi:hypothetical protein